MASKRRGPPRGYKPVAEEIGEMQTKISDMLQAARYELAKNTGLDTTVHIARNKDGSLDAEWRVTHIPRGRDINSVIYDMNGLVSPIPRTWMRAVLRYTAPEGVDTGDRRYRGQSEVWSGFYRNTDKNQALLPLAVTGPKGMLAHLTGRRRRKPTEVLLRWHWNPDIIQPNLFRRRYAKKYHKAD